MVLAHSLDHIKAEFAVVRGVNPYRNVACVLHIYLLPCCTYCAYTLHTCCTYNTTILHVCCIHKNWLSATQHMYATHVQLLCAAYMLHVNNCTQTAYNVFICLYGMRVALSQFLCMQHAANMDVLCVQHACNMHV